MPLIFRLTDSVSSYDDLSIVSGLPRLGLTVEVCTSMADLTRQVDAARQQAPLAPLVVIIDARSTATCSATSAVRALYPQAGIVVLSSASAEHSLLVHLQSGADSHCEVSASSELLAATVFRVLWRMQFGQPPHSHPAPRVGEQTGWQLVNQGWALCAPSGVSIGLTTSERAFMTALFESPGMQATHEQLLAAINNLPDSGHSPKQQSHLGIMISRLRRKFNQANEPLPLQSIHNWGYMFVAEDTLTATPEAPENTDASCD